MLGCCLDWRKSIVHLADTASCQSHPGRHGMLRSELWPSICKHLKFG